MVDNNCKNRLMEVRERFERERETTKQNRSKDKKRFTLKYGKSKRKKNKVIYSTSFVKRWVLCKNPELNVKITICCHR